MLHGNATLSVGGDRSNSASYSGPISGSGGVTKISSGKQTLDGMNTYTGATTVNAGTLLLDFANLASPDNVTANASALTLGGGRLSVLERTGPGVVTNQTLGDLTLAAHTASAILLDPNNSGAGGTTLTLGNTWIRNAAATLFIDYSAPGSGARIVRTLGPVTGTGAVSHGLFPYVLVKDAGGVGFATQDASFNIVRSTATSIVLSTSNSVAETPTADFTTVSTDPDYSSPGGTLMLDNAVHCASTLTIDSTGGSTLDLGGTAEVPTFSSNGLLVYGDGDYTIENGALDASGSELIVHQIGAGVLTIASPLTGGTGSLTKDGSDTLRLTGIQDYSTLSTNGGTTNLEVMLGTGSSTLKADAATNINISQTLAALNIGANGVVTLRGVIAPFAADSEFGDEAGPFCWIRAHEPGSERCSGTGHWQPCRQRRSAPRIAQEADCFRGLTHSHHCFAGFVHVPSMTTFVRSMREFS